MPTAEEAGRAISYRDASTEHLTVAFELYERGRFVQSNYLGGLSVECMLRAYRVMIDPVFDSRHDIGALFELAKFGDITTGKQTQELGAALGDVVTLWSNDHRFLSLQALRKRWTRQKRFVGIKGDFVKELTSQLLESSAVIVNAGAVRWKNSFES